MTSAPRVLDAEGLIAAARAYQRAGGLIESTVTGRSMGTTLPDGARIRIEARPGLAPAENTVVALLGGATGVVTHRVVAVHRDWLVTRGDALLFCDPPTPLARLLGEVREARTAGEWRPLAPPPPRGSIGRVVAALHRALVRGALALHPPLAGVVARSAFRAAAVTRIATGRTADRRAEGDRPA